MSFGRMLYRLRAITQTSTATTSHAAWGRVAGIAAAGLGAGIAASVLSAERFSESQPIYIVAVGSLLEIDYSRSVKAFGDLARAQGKPFVLTQEKMKAILSVDAHFKSGKIGAPQFRKSVCGILNIQPSDEQFDQAWNAMLGDNPRQTLSGRIQSVRAVSSRVLFWSGTNPIHAQALGIEQLRSVFLSYKNHCVGINCYEKLLDQQRLATAQVVLALPSRRTEVNDIRRQEETEALEVRKWASQQGIDVCECDTGSKFIKTFQSCVQKHTLPVTEGAELQSNRSRRMCR
jgi:hypothetical protein